MSIDPNNINTVRVGQLADAPFNNTDLIPHEVGTELKKGTVQALSEFIALNIETSSGVAFRAVTVLDGETLPNTAQEEWILVGKGTFYNVGGGATIITTEELNAIMSNGTFWSIGVEIPIEATSSGGGGGTTDDILNESEVPGTTTTDALNNLDAKIPITYSKIVYVNTTYPTNPIAATIFDIENPPLTNDNALKEDVNNLYVDAGNIAWVYKTSPAGYSTRAVTSETSNFYLSGTTTDAGNTKTSDIERSGNIQIVNADSRYKGGTSVGRVLLSNSSVSAWVEVDGSGHTTPNRIAFATTTGFIVFVLNGLEKLRVHNSGGMSLGSTTDPGAGNLRASGLAGTGTRQVTADSTGKLSASQNQIEVSGNQTTQLAWDLKEVTFMSSGLHTIPNTLPDQFSVDIAADIGVTVTWAITSPFTWRVAGLAVGVAPPAMTEGQFCTVSRRTGTNEIRVRGL